MSSSPSWLLVATVMAADDNVCWPYHKTHGSSLVRSAIQWAPTRKKLGWKNVRLVFSRFMINLTEETVLKVGCHTKSHITANVKRSLCSMVATKQEREPRRQTD